jgi:hypothetical protein
MLTLDNPPIKPFRNKNDFSIYIETYAITNGVSLIDSLLQYCEDADVDMDRCAKLVSDSLKDKLEDEAVKNQFILRKTTALPFF